jgi:hypothetical protein
MVAILLEEYYIGLERKKSLGEHDLTSKIFLS